jgi:hypothetical protein
VNKRLDVAAQILQSLALSEGKGAEVKTFAEYRQDAAPVLIASDKVLFSPENLTEAIVNAGYEPAEYLEQFLKVAAELQNPQPEGVFTLTDMKKAWANGHVDGFWDARQTSATKPEPVATTERKLTYTEADVERAEKEGYVSGWSNGILSNSDLSSDPAKMPLLGAEHGKAYNPYSEKDSNDA